jgi:hypothetical protein
MSAIRQRRARPEDVIHRSVVMHLRQRGTPGVVWWHTPNGAFLGGKRSRKGTTIQGSILRGMGMLPGVSDIVAVHAGRFYALELKGRGGKPTDAQLAFIERVKCAGGHAGWVEGLDRALYVLENWGLLRGHADGAQ